MFCPNCGTQLADDTKFCARCGRPTGGAECGAGAPPPPVQAVPMVPVAAPAPSSNVINVQIGNTGPAAKPQKLLCGCTKGIHCIACVLSLGFWWPCCCAASCCGYD